MIIVIWIQRIRHKWKVWWPVVIGVWPGAQLWLLVQYRITQCLLLCAVVLLPFLPLYSTARTPYSTHYRIVVWSHALVPYVRLDRLWLCAWRTSPPSAAELYSQEGDLTTCLTGTPPTQSPPIPNRYRLIYILPQPLTALSLAHLLPPHRRCPASL